MEKEIKVMDKDLVISQLERYGLKNIFSEFLFGLSDKVYEFDYMTKKRLRFVYGLDCIDINLLGKVVYQIERFVDIVNSEEGSFSYISCDVVRGFKKVLVDNIKGYFSVCSFEFDMYSLSVFVIDYLFRMFVDYEYLDDMDSIINIRFLGNSAKLVGLSKDEMELGFKFKDENYKDDSHDRLESIYISNCYNTIAWNIYEVSRFLGIDGKELLEEIKDYSSYDFNILMRKLKDGHVDIKSNKNMPEDVRKKNEEYYNDIKFIIKYNDDDNDIKDNSYKRNYIRKYDSITGELLDTYYSIKEAVEKNEGYKKEGISQCINGKRKRYKDFVWKKD